MQFKGFVVISVLAYLSGAIAIAIPDIDQTAAAALADCAQKRDASSAGDTQVLCPFG
ncbi:hypothetical protein BKA66DRAFT_577395 [Pyrenochaeta sp. MPI-SDFR-AT-0127]|nr:hypothetical protein BKA66DRAFT_577395 [Pyrenochaeta sp. MPI-SDFR-AT-0127]